MLHPVPNLSKKKKRGEIGLVSFFILQWISKPIYLNNSKNKKFEKLNEMRDKYMDGNKILRIIKIKFEFMFLNFEFKK